MLERAEEIRKSKIQAEKGFHKGSSQYSGGFGSSSSMSSNTYSASTYDTPSYDSHSSNYSSNLSSSTLNSSKPNKAMKLGSNKDVLPAFIEQQIKQTLPSTPASSSSTFTPTPAINTERVHLKVDEKISLTCGKDGGVQNLEVLGVLTVRIASEDESRIKIGLRNNDTRNLQIQVIFFLLELKI